MSALPPKADIAERDRHVRFVPKADVSRWSIRLIRYVGGTQLNARNSAHEMS